MRSENQNQEVGNSESDTVVKSEPVAAAVASPTASPPPKLQRTVEEEYEIQEDVSRERSNAFHGNDLVKAMKNLKLKSPVASPVASPEQLIEGMIEENVSDLLNKERHTKAKTESGKKEAAAAEPSTPSAEVAAESNTNEVASPFSLPSPKTT